MLEQLRKKRIQLAKNIEGRQRISSAQKRKAIETKLEEFKRQKFYKPTSPIKSAQNFNTPHSLIEESRKLAKTHTQLPSFGRQNPFDQHLNGMIDRNLSPQRQEETQEPHPLIQRQENEGEQKNIKGQQLGKSQQNLQVIEQKKEQETDTAQFNQLRQLPETPKEKSNQHRPDPPMKQETASPKKLQIITEIEPVSQQNQAPQDSNSKSKSPKKVTFDLQGFPGGLISPVSASLGGSGLKNIQSLEPTYQKKQQDPEGLNFNYNNSHYGNSSSNNSSAILFTSQFKQYLNRENSPPKNQIEPSKEDSNDREVSQSFLRIGEGDDDVSEEIQNVRKIRTNESGASLLALSNSRNDDQSLLKYSHANSGVQELVNKKLDRELVMEIGDFARTKLMQLGEKYQTKHKQQISNFITGFKQYKKVTKLIRAIKIIELRFGFDEILVANEYQLYETKNQIKIERFRKQKQEEQLHRILNEWQAIIQHNQTKAVCFQLRKNAVYKKNIFKVLKMIWFDNKVAKQADLYYLSKVFTCWRETIKTEQKKDKHMALKQYCKSLKRQYFYKILEGVDNMRQQRENNERAQDFYQYSLLRKHFDAWSNSSAREPQYISLAMTSKNTFKETQDHRWLQTKTVNFEWKNMAL